MYGVFDGIFYKLMKIDIPLENGSFLNSALTRLFLAVASSSMYLEHE